MPGLNTIPESNEGLPQWAGDEVWLVLAEVHEILPEYLFATKSVNINAERGSPGAPLSLPRCHASDDDYAFLVFTWWSAMLAQSGKMRVSAYRSHDRHVWLECRYRCDGDTQQVEIEMCPPMSSYRQEWDRQHLAGKSTDELKKAFAEQILNELPLAVLLSPMPKVVSSLNLSERTGWIEKELTKRDLPLADDSGYSTSDVRFGGYGDPGLLICYAPREHPTTLQQWIDWVQQNIPGAFKDPLLTTVSPPELLNTAVVSVVEVSRDDLSDPSGLAEIDVDVAEAEERIKAGFSQEGTELLGWYQPYHCYDEWHWGIYLNSAAIVDLGAVLRKHLSAVDCPQPNAAYKIAVHLILEHEFFHAQMETFALGQELFSRRPVFQSYNKAVYGGTRGSSQALEEAAANFVARRACKNLVLTFGWSQKAISEVMDFIHTMFELSPPGYRDWFLAGKPNTWRQLATQVTTGSLEVHNPVPPLEPFLESLPKGCLRINDVPVWMTTDHSAPDRLFGVPTRREVVRLLRSLGYVSRPGKGSHEVWQAPDGRHFALPAAMTLSRLVFHELLLHLALSKKEYMSARMAF